MDAFLNEVKNCSYEFQDNIKNFRHYEKFEFNKTTQRNEFMSKFNMNLSLRIFVKTGPGPDI